MKRRDFIRQAAASALVATPLVGCSSDTKQQASKAPQNNKTYKWKLITAWPKNYPGLGTAAENLAKTVTAISKGRLQIKVFGAGELVPALEVFDAVRSGAAEMGHSAASYWQGKNRAFNFFYSIPFGLNGVEMLSWLYHGGGQALWNEGYEKFGVVPLPLGTTGAQMGGWYNREINSVGDLEGIKIRIPGLGSAVCERIGMVPINLPGGELYTALQTGMLDAIEWSTPYNDLSFGFHKIAKYYYYPGWQEPGSILECIINQEKYLELPQDLQHILHVACQAIGMDTLTEYLAANSRALKVLVDKHKVQMRRFPDPIINRFREVSREVLLEVANESDYARRVYNSFSQFKKDASRWINLSERVVYNVRDSQ